jgi:hypothetical protein
MTTSDIIYLTIPCATFMLTAIITAVILIRLERRR